jgi:hypothetical protein
MLNDHEEKFVQSFVVKSKSERIAVLLASHKRRKDFLKTLSHFGDLEPKYAKCIPATQAHSPEEWLRLLRSKGAPELCWIISEDAKLDGREENLGDALRQTIGHGMGTVLSCVPGRLGYFEDEGKQRLLER